MSGQTASIRQKALSLRKAGHSYRFIAARTGLSKATLSDWLKDIPYSPNQSTLRAISKALAASIEAGRKKKQANILLSKQEAKREIGTLSSRDLFMFGLGLYLGEGSKTRDLVRVVNADPRVIKLAIAWFKNMGVSTKNFVLTLHLYPDSNIKKSILYWSKETAIPKEQFLKTQIDWRKNKKTYKLGKLPYGTAHLGIRALGEKRFGTFLFRKINACTEECFNQIASRV